MKLVVIRIIQFHHKSSLTSLSVSSSGRSSLSKKTLICLLVLASSRFLLDFI
uniref:Uncharacterized protein n=1 Tax=Arundo donax TaxID=35708 RepID=A0A0A9FLB9_ARUDO